IAQFVQQRRPTFLELSAASVRLLTANRIADSSATCGPIRRRCQHTIDDRAQFRDTLGTHAKSGTAIGKKWTKYGMRIPLISPDLYGKDK
ncbi:MAG: hypothetical protein KIT36_15415, partial [Alphaproteobacteria bacterium]|nr:hypothetical protein [Alphaproteobacteria bacterium]